MELFRMFKSPCLDEDNGANLGGGGIPAGTPEQQETTQSSDTNGQLGQEQTQQTHTEQPRIKVKFNHAEKEFGIDEAVPYVQKGLKYDDIFPEYEQLKSDPSRTFVQAQAQRYNMTVPQYLSAVREAEEREQLDSLVQQNIPEEYAKEMLDNRKFREQYESERKAAEEKNRVNADYQSFFEAYPDVKPDEIPPQVFIKAKADNVPLKYAYKDYEAEMYKAEVAKYKQKEQITSANQANAATSTGSAKASGNATNGYYTKEQVDSMSVDQINKNYKAVMASMKSWK